MWHLDIVDKWKLCKRLGLGMSKVKKKFSISLYKATRERIWTLTTAQHLLHFPISQLNRFDEFFFVSFHNFTWFPKQSECYLLSLFRQRLVFIKHFSFTCAAVECFFKRFLFVFRRNTNWKPMLFSSTITAECSRKKHKQCMTCAIFMCVVRVWTSNAHFALLHRNI